MSELLDDDALELGRHVDRDFLERLELHAVLLLDDDLRLGDRELVALAAHVLEQDGDVELAAAVDLEAVRLGEVDLEADVDLELLLEARADLARVHELARATDERRGVHEEVERDGRLVDANRRQRLRGRIGAEGVADVDLREARDEADVARGDLGRLLARGALKGEELGDLARVGAAVRRLHGEGVADLDHAVVDAGYGEAAHEVVVAEVERLRAQRQRRVTGRDRHLLEDDVEERVDRLARVVELPHRDRVLADRVDGREVHLLGGGAELHEELEDLLLGLVRVRRRLVDLVDHDDRLVAELERLLEHEAGLRHRALLGVDDEEHAVDGAQHALDLGAEVGVPRGVDDVDLGALVEGTGVLGVDGDAALALDGVRVHGHTLLEHAGAAHDGVREGRLAVVDVRDDGDVADFHRGNWLGAGG
jgi:hypothetical protein